MSQKYKVTGNDFVCPHCGGQLQPTEAVCAYCGGANPLYRAPRPAPAATTTTYTPTYTPTYTSDSFFSYADNTGKAVIILTGLISLAFLLIELNGRWSYYAFYAAGGTGPGSGFQLMLVIFGPLSAFWTMNAFLAPDSKWRILSWIFLIGLFFVHLMYFASNTDTYQLN
jgi:hypothetical protein